MATKYNKLHNDMWRCIAILRQVIVISFQKSVMAVFDGLVFVENCKIWIVWIHVNQRNASELYDSILLPSIIFRLSNVFITVDWLLVAVIL